MSFMDRDVYGQLSFGALRILLRFVLAVVSLEVLLRNAVECERGNRAFEERSRHAPCAVGAAPAAEVVAVDPDQVFVQVFVHGNCLCVPGSLFGITIQTVMRNLPRNPPGSQVPKVLHRSPPKGQDGRCSDARLETLGAIPRGEVSNFS